MRAGSPFRHVLRFATLVASLGPAVALDRVPEKPRAMIVQTGSTVDPSGSAAAIARGQGPAERGQLTVTVDRAKVIRLPETTKTVIVGNPAIADVSIQRTGIVVVTGKSYGVTNLIALDGTGGLLAESILSVQAPSDAVVTVQRGLDRQSYSCTPSCQPSILLGDANPYFNENKAQADQHSQFATQR